MDQQKLPINNVLRILNDQRKTGQFCDITIKLSNDFQVWAHFCVLAPQSDFIGDKYFLQKDMQFSIHNPLKIEIFNFNCEECLCDLLDLVYCDDVAIFGEHEEHMKNLTKMLNIHDPDILRSVIAIPGLASSATVLENNDPVSETLLTADDDKITDTAIVANNSVKFQVSSKQRKSTSYQYKMKTQPSQSKMNSCHGCSFKCYRPCEMLMHLNSCDTQNTKCNLCDVTFKNLTEFKGHLIRHDNFKPFFCTDCDLRFATKGALNLHTPKHSNATLHICSVCGKGFKWKHGLESHMLVHSNEKKLLCDECGYGTSHLKTLRAHQLSHTGFSFKCTVTNCTYTSRRKENLKIHIATHKKESPFVCEVCGKRFSQSKNLKRHSLLHLGNKNIKCPHCSFITYRSDKLKEHIAWQHTEKPLQLELPEDVQSVLKESDPFIEQPMKKKRKPYQRKVTTITAPHNSSVFETSEPILTNFTQENLLNFNDVIMFEEKPETIVTVCTDSMDILNGNIVLF